MKVEELGKRIKVPEYLLPDSIELDQVGIWGYLSKEFGNIYHQYRFFDLVGGGSILCGRSHPCAGHLDCYRHTTSRQRSQVRAEQIVAGNIYQIKHFIVFYENIVFPEDIVVGNIS